MIRDLWNFPEGSSGELLSLNPPSINDQSREGSLLRNIKKKYEKCVLKWYKFSYFFMENCVIALGIQSLMKNFIFFYEIPLNRAKWAICPVTGMQVLLWVVASPLLPEDCI